MSEMSFKQAKELAERLELSEVTLKQTLSDIQKATGNFEISLKKQKKILEHIPASDNRLTTMKIIVALNVGFIIGLLVSKYIISG